jgi:cyclopropane-fatty-acyl-phospholipid synthase
VEDGSYDKIAAVGVIEHVGGRDPRSYVAKVGGLLARAACSSTTGSSVSGQSASACSPTAAGSGPGTSRRSPTQLEALTATGLEIRDSESLRARYPLTLLAWLRNLAAAQRGAITLIRAQRERVWRVYMTASIGAFERGEISIHQTLAAAPPARHATLLAARLRGTQPVVATMR